MPSFSLKNIGLIGFTVLSSCSSYKESFDCPVGVGATCQSISQVNQRVEQGHLPSSQTLAAQGPGAGGIPVSSCPQPQMSCCRAAVVSPVYKYHGVVRIPEQHLRIWIAPFHDLHGNFHDENVIYTVLRPGQWVRKG